MVVFSRRNKDISRQVFCQSECREREKERNTEHTDFGSDADKGADTLMIASNIGRMSGKMAWMRGSEGGNDREAKGKAT